MQIIQSTCCSSYLPVADYPKTLNGTHITFNVFYKCEGICFELNYLETFKDQILHENFEYDHVTCNPALILVQCFVYSSVSLPAVETAEVTPNYWADQAQTQISSAHTLLSPLNLK